MNTKKYISSTIPTENVTSYSVYSHSNYRDNYIKNRQLYTYFSMHDKNPEGFRKVLPTSIDLFSQSKLNLNKIDDERTKKNVILILYQIIRSIIKKDEMDTIHAVLSKLELSYLEDKSVIIEWIFCNFRAGFTIEPNLNDSATYIVVDNRENRLFQSASQLMDESNYEQLIDEVIDFVTRNA